MTLGAGRHLTGRSQMDDREVMLVYAHVGSVRAEFMASVIKALTTPTPITHIYEMRGALPNIVRNELIKYFMISKYEWLWMVDADMVFSRETLPTLLKVADPDEAPLVSPLYYVQKPGGEPVLAMYTAVDNDKDVGFHSYAEYEPDTLMQVAAVGGGCLLFHRSVFERIDAFAAQHGGENCQWYSELVVNGRQYGDDISMCMRAALAGIPIHVHTGIQVGHMKTVRFGDVTP